MGRVIEIQIRDKIAKRTNDITYVCGNSDYVVCFDFDEEWNEFQLKTARFISDNGEYIDCVFEGNQCEFPKMSDTYRVKIGVFAGNLHTTTSAFVGATKSILCPKGLPADPVPDVYAQIMEKIDAGMLKGDKGDKGDKGERGEPGAPGKDGANGNDGADGKDADPYVLPVATADTLGGVKVGEGLQMDGDVLGVMPGNEYELIETFTTDADIGYPFARTEEPDGKPYNFRKIYVEITNPAWTKALDKWPQIDTHNGMHIQASWSGIVSKSQAMRGYLVCEVTREGMLSIRSNVSSVSPSGNYTAINGNAFDLAADAADTVRRFYLWATENGPIIAGTTIKIRGVRA